MAVPENVVNVTEKDAKKTKVETVLKDKKNGKLVELYFRISGDLLEDFRVVVAVLGRRSEL